MSSYTLCSAWQKSDVKLKFPNSTAESTVQLKDLVSLKDFTTEDGFLRKFLIEKQSLGYVNANP